MRNWTGNPIGARVANVIWWLGVRLRDGAKRVGLLGPLDQVLGWLGPRLIPPPSTSFQASVPPAGALIVPAGAPSARNFLTGSYERDVTATLQQCLRPGMTFMDVGANIGYFTVLAAQAVGPGGHVYAFEPDPEAFAYLERNAAAAQAGDSTVENLAVAAFSGVMPFTRTEFERGYLSREPSETRVVRTTSLDDYFAARDWPPVHVIKMDIEGGEVDALRGATELFGRNPDLQIVVELNTVALRRAGRTAAELGAELRRLGLTRHRLIERGLQDVDLIANGPSGWVNYNLLAAQG